MVSILEMYYGLAPFRELKGECGFTKIPPRASLGATPSVEKDMLIFVNSAINLYHTLLIAMVFIFLH